MSVMHYTDDKHAAPLLISNNVVPAQQRSCRRIIYFAPLALLALGFVLFNMCTKAGMADLSLHQDSVPGMAVPIGAVSSGHAIKEHIKRAAGKSKPKTTSTSTSSAATATVTAMQAYVPVLVPDAEGVLEFSNGTTNVATSLKIKPGTKVVTQTLMEYTFAESYDIPFVGNYTPPKDLSFNRVVFSQTVYISGVQYDRLASVWLGSTEIWRPTTAEPLNSEVTWTYLKDMTPYLPLFKQKQSLIYSLNNIYDSSYTGEFNTTLTATFFTTEDTIEVADEILPISSDLGSTGEPSIFTVPTDNATSTLAIPRRTTKAIVTIAATGQSDEEFWWQDVFENQADLLSAASEGVIYGYGPFREIQLYIDGKLAGVAWPYPNIFSGGVSPALWKPIVGIDVFDLRENEIDITPWLPLLCDGSKHTFDIKVASVATNDANTEGEVADTVGSYWLVSGKVFLWYGDEGSSTTGTMETHSAPVPTVKVSSSVSYDVNGTAEGLNYTTAVERTFSVSSKVKTADGTTTATWSQKLSYSNSGKLWAYGYSQYNYQNTNGVDRSSSGYSRQISYPLYAEQSLVVSDILSIQAVVNRTQSIQITGSTVFPSGIESFNAADETAYGSSSYVTTQNATGYYEADSVETTNATVIYGTNSQVLTFSGTDVAADEGLYTYPAITGSKVFYRETLASVNDTYVENEASVLGQSVVDYSHPSGPSHY